MDKFLELYTHLLSLAPTSIQKYTRPTYLKTSVFRLALGEKYTAWSDYNNSPNLFTLSFYYFQFAL